MSQWGDGQHRTRSDFVYGDVSQAQNKAHQITFKAPLELELLVFDAKCPVDFTGFPWTQYPGHWIPLDTFYVQRMTLEEGKESCLVGSLVYFEDVGTQS